MAKKQELKMLENCEYVLTANGISDSSSESSGNDENVDRGNWSNKIEFVLSCLSYAVGLGNVWRFPYVCYRNGAGAFLIPFVIMLGITGIPLVYLELSFGQFGSSGVVSIWKASPLFQGVGWAMFTVSFLIAVYYNMIIAYILYYLFASLQSMLPWAECGSWSSDACALVDIVAKKNCTEFHGVWCNKTCTFPNEVDNSSTWAALGNCSTKDPKSASDEYFHKVVLDISDGIDDMGSVKWQLVLCLLLAWVLVCICLARGIKSGGKAAYFTAFFPYLVLSILLVRGLTLKGSWAGIGYFFTPQWHRLGDAKVWGDAAIQIFFSLSTCWGGLITLSSYNKFHNNCFKDAVIVSVMVCFTSVFAGVVIFSIIGYMAAELNEPVSTVVKEGSGLAFIVYPEIVTKLPISQLWSVLFFLMMFTLGIGTQISTVTTVHTTLLDSFPSTFRKNQKRQVLLLITIATLCFLIGLAFAFQGGMYILQLFDNYVATYSLLIIGVVESLALSWVYGGARFLTDIECMLGSRPNIIWLWCWKVVAPVTLLGVLLFTWIDFKPSQYEEVVFPPWADGIGWVLSLTSVLAIPAIMIFKIVQRKKNFGDGIINSLKFLCKPDPGWGPAKKENQTERRAMNKFPAEQQECALPLTEANLTSVNIDDNGVPVKLV